MSKESTKQWILKQLISLQSDMRKADHKSCNSSTKPVYKRSEIKILSSAGSDNANNRPVNHLSKVDAAHDPIRKTSLPDRVLL